MTGDALTGLQDDSDGVVIVALHIAGGKIARWVGFGEDIITREQMAELVGAVGVSSGRVEDAQFVGQVYLYTSQRDVTRTENTIDIDVLVNGPGNGGINDQDFPG